MLPIGAAWSNWWLVLKPIGEFALVFFAGVQLYEAWKERRERRRAAYWAFYAEYWRVQAVNLEWQGADLLSLVRAGLLHPDDLPIRDWAAFARMMGEVSSATAAMGAFAYSVLNQAYVLARALVAAPRRPLESEDKKVKECKDRLKNAAGLLDDALRCAPRWLTQSKMEFPDLRSDSGKKVQRLMLAATGQVEPRFQPRAGAIGRIIGSGLARVARWFNPAAGWALESQVRQLESTERPGR